MILWMLCLFALFLFFFWGLLMLFIPRLRFRLRIRRLISSITPKRKFTKQPVLGPRMRALELELQMLNIPFPITRLIGSFIAFHVLMVIIGFISKMIPSLLLIVVVDVILLATLRIIPSKRRKKISAQLPETLSMMTSSLKSGYSILQTVNLIGKENRLKPLSDEFALIYHSLQLGDSLERAFRQFDERIRLEEVHSMVDAILITREIGGNLTSVIDRLIEMIQDANRLQREVKSITAQGRISAWIVGSLPFALSGILYFLSPDYILILFHNPIGIALVCLAFTLQIIGIVILVRMTKMKVR